MMSTRSGKRIHSSFHENANNTMMEDHIKSERKTRSKRPKENLGDSKPSKSKKRHNYVSILQGFNEEELSVPTRATLREQDLNVSKENDTADSVVDNGKLARQLRRTKKVAENTNEGPLENVVVDKIPKNKKKSKKNKKNLATSETVIECVEETVHVAKKKKGKVGKNVKSEILDQASAQITTLDKSNGSVDSFHSAAGSPVTEPPSIEAEKLNVSLGKSPRRASKRLLNGSHVRSENVSLNDVSNSSSKRAKLSVEQTKTPVKSPRSSRSKSSGSNKKNSKFDKPNADTEELLNATFEKELSSKSKISVKNTTFEKTESSEMKLNSTYEKDKTLEQLNVTYEADNESKRKSLRSGTVDIVDKQVDKVSLNSTFDKPKNSSPDNLNDTYENDDESKKELLRPKPGVENHVDKALLNSTFEKPKSSTPDKLNTTNEGDSKSTRKSLRLSGVEKQAEKASLNSTFDKTKTSNESAINTTFDKETKLDSTFDKTETKSISSTKSSLISSDATLNVTFDKSDDNSRISITSDDSRTENIVNTTPVLIESSLDESQIEPSPKEKTTQNDKPKTSATPLKREGTFTKDGPDVIKSPKPKLSTEKTPTKRMSLPSPGCTPFHISKSSQKDKSIMNLTHSIEKSGRRSSLAEPVRRTTKVMFCSPVNNPAVVQQQKRKVIKSNLKGSNKSFIFDESVSEVVRPATRKRSYTHNDADDARAKRTRRDLTDTLQKSADRLSRPRTASVTVKLTEPSTPSKKLLTPAKKNGTPKAKSETKSSRTKLPNFAALHQKQFAKMESLDECQERKARRAKQLLTPTGALAAADRNSPKTRGTAMEPMKAVKEAPKKDTPTKAPKLPTLESLRPGFTRFGFKMNFDVNPFSVPPKPDPKPREKKPNGILTKLPSQPSLAGATTRREIAKQTVMREKSFPSLSDRRDLKRKENRTMIKGVRTNRRFELQMKMRNVNA